MNADDLMDSIGEIDEDMVEAVDALRTAKKKKSPWVRWGTMAACCALALALGYSALQSADILVQPGSESDPASSQSTAEPAATPTPAPKVELLAYPDRLVLPTAQEPEPQPFAWPELSFGGMGYESYWMKDFSEFHTGNPWTPEMQLDTLPVYRNTVLYDEELSPQNADFALMQGILRAAVSRLGLEADVLKLDDNSADEQEKQAIQEKYEAAGMTPPPEENLTPAKVAYEAEGIRIQVGSSYRLKINLDKPRPYPPELLSGSAGLEQAEKKAHWLAGEYADLLNMEQPTSAVQGGDYSYVGDRRYAMGIYDAAGSDLEKILHYNFYRAEFCDDDDGNLFLIWLSFPDLTDLLGNYPAITPEQARQELLAGRYVTSVPYEVPADAQIARVELVYRGETYDPLYVPYYKFYVDVTDAPEHYTGESMKGLRDYGAYYVPAIDPAYLTGLPLWDGRIN